MAVARAQQQGGVTAIHIWLIVFVALWLTSTVFLVILYVNQEDKDRLVGDAKASLIKILPASGRDLPQFSEATSSPGGTMVELLESARGDTAELIGGNRTDDVASLRVELSSRLDRFAADQHIQSKSDFEGATLLAALDTMHSLFRAEAETRKKAEQGVSQLTADLAELRGAEERRKKDYDEAADQFEGDLVKIGDDRDQYKAERDDEIDAFDAQIEKIKDQSSADIQKQRSETRKCQADYDELLARHQELQAKLGQSQITPIPMATARVGDGRILKASPGDPIVYINLGREDHLTLGLEFAVYDALSGIPEDGRPKARIEVVAIHRQSAECKIVSLIRDQMILEEDIIANPIYDRHQALKFFVMGEFDLNGDGRDDPRGRRDIESLIEQWGGTSVAELSAKVDFVVLGSPPVRPRRSVDVDPEDDPKYQAAAKAYAAFEAQLAKVDVLAVPRLSQKVFLNFLGYTTSSTETAASIQALAAP
ncbi:MAG: hypothetical protein GXP29_09610 [Planctomycetes bacterium]|nr:hypothetical protein [Planctomycetota bacterium]